MARPISAPAVVAGVPDFIAIDVETANHDAGSICQIGFATFADGVLVDNWSWLINPQTWFSTHNIGIHGIRAADVAAAPSWPEVHAEIAALLTGRIVVSHTAFDVTATARACAPRSSIIGASAPSARSAAPWG